MGIYQEKGGMAGGYAPLDVNKYISFSLPDVTKQNWIYSSADAVFAPPLGYIEFLHPAGLLSRYGIKIGTISLVNGAAVNDSYFELYSGDTGYISMHNKSGVYGFQRNMTDNTVYIQEGYTGENMLKIVRLAANDYRLYVNQGGSWVLK